MDYKTTVILMVIAIGCAIGAVILAVLSIIT